MGKKNSIEVPDIDEKKILDMMANTSLQDRLAQKREQRQMSGADKSLESTPLTEVANPDLKSDEVLSDRQPKKTMSAKQRKSDLSDYQQTFLSVPKITDRKTVFISNGLREQLVCIVRRLGTEKSSVSGFIENLVTLHLEEYREDIENWKKL